MFGNIFLLQGITCIGLFGAASHVFEQICYAIMAVFCLIHMIYMEHKTVHYKSWQDWLDSYKDFDKRYNQDEMIVANKSFNMMLKYYSGEK